MQFWKRVPRKSTCIIISSKQLQKILVPLIIDCFTTVTSLSRRNVNNEDISEGECSTALKPISSIILKKYNKKKKLEILVSMKQNEIRRKQESRIEKFTVWAICERGIREKTEVQGDKDRGQRREKGGEIEEGVWLVLRKWFWRRCRRGCWQRRGERELGPWWEVVRPWVLGFWKNGWWEKKKKVLLLL